MTKGSERKSHQVVHREAKTTDGVAITYTLWRRPARELLILAPGFWRVRLARENLFLANFFVRRGYDVVVLDFRGHGDSKGSYTFGTFEAHGLRMLPIRVNEMEALARLDELSRTREFMSAMGRAVARPVGSAINIVRNPVGTAKGVPAGVGRLFRRA